MVYGKKNLNTTQYIVNHQHKLRLGNYVTKFHWDGYNTTGERLYTDIK